MSLLFNSRTIETRFNAMTWLFAMMANMLARDVIWIRGERAITATIPIIAIYHSGLGVGKSFR